MNGLYCQLCQSYPPCQHTRTFTVPASTEPPLTEARLREIIREELWRFHNPNRAYHRDLASQQAQLGKPRSVQDSLATIHPHWTTK